ALGILHTFAAGCRFCILPDCDPSIGSCSPLEGDGRRARRLTQPDPQGSGFFVVRFFVVRFFSCRTIWPTWTRPNSDCANRQAVRHSTTEASGAAGGRVAAAKREKPINRFIDRRLRSWLPWAACLVLTVVPLLAQQGSGRGSVGPPKGDIRALIRGLPQPPLQGWHPLRRRGHQDFEA